jgi:hypothetical protein
MASHGWAHSQVPDISHFLFRLFAGLDGVVAARLRIDHPTNAAWMSAKPDFQQNTSADSSSSR